MPTAACIRFETADGAVLYVRDTAGEWALPGGLLAKGETADQAARRHARALAIAVSDSIQMPEIEHDEVSETSTFLCFVDSAFYGVACPGGYAWARGGMLRETPRRERSPTDAR